MVAALAAIAEVPAGLHADPFGIVAGPAIAVVTASQGSIDKGQLAGLEPLYHGCKVDISNLGMVPFKNYDVRMGSCL